MIIQYVSDLHIEFKQNREYLEASPIKPVGEILLLAGDIVPFAEMEKHGDFFNFLSDNFKITYWLPGNHEYYRFDLSEREGTLDEKIRDNVYLVNNISKNHGGINLIFTTLWSYIKPDLQWDIEKSLNDFELIKYNGKRLTADVFNSLHLASLNYLKKEFEQSVTHRVVITHHVPTFMNYPEKFRGSTLNAAFATELFELIEVSDIDYWIYGHHHVNIPEFTIDNTCLLTNQLGYMSLGEHTQFNHEKHIVLTPPGLTVNVQ